MICGRKILDWRRVGRRGRYGCDEGWNGEGKGVSWRVLGIDRLTEAVVP